MGRKRSPLPQYRTHRGGIARAVWTDLDGKRHFRNLPGAYGSDESKKAFGQLVLQLQSGSTPQPRTRGSEVYLADVLDRFMEHAERHYLTKDGKPSGEYDSLDTVAKILNDLFGDTLAADFGPIALKSLRQEFINRGWVRRSVNQQIERVRRIFKWAVAEELFPPDKFTALQAVTGLAAGRTAAPESEPVRPVPDEVLDATLPHLGRHVRGMVEFQRYTGCRPGEACRLRLADVDRSGPIWVYRPPHHKTAHRGKTRAIAIGPKAQLILAGFLNTPPAAFVFSPRAAVEEVRAAREAKRKTPRYPSHMARNAAKRRESPKRTPADHYTARSYSVAVARACLRAFPPPKPLRRQKGETVKEWKARLTEKQQAELRKWIADHSWHPNQIRHGFATRVRKEHGLEAAQVVLGHARADVTQIYAERNEALAVEVAAKSG